MKVNVDLPKNGVRLSQNERSKGWNLAQSFMEACAAAITDNHVGSLYASQVVKPWEKGEGFTVIAMSS